MTRLKEWLDFLFGTGQPPTGYDRADAWASTAGAGCLVAIVLGVALVIWVLVR